MKTFGLRIFSLAFCLFLTVWPHAAKGREPVVKTGHSFVPFPMVGFDGAKGFLFGGLMNVYNFGDGSTYPNPRSSAYFEVSGYTGGSKTFVASYDSGRLLPEVRMNLAASYCADNSMEFFGFGGRRTFYDSSMADGFYKYDRATLNIKADFPERFRIICPGRWAIISINSKSRTIILRIPIRKSPCSGSTRHGAWFRPRRFQRNIHPPSVPALSMIRVTMRVYLQREFWPGRMSSPRLVFWALRSLT